MSTIRTSNNSHWLHLIPILSYTSWLCLEDRPVAGNAAGPSCPCGHVAVLWFSTNYVSHSCRIDRASHRPTSVVRRSPQPRPVKQLVYYSMLNCKRIGPYAHFNSFVMKPSISRRPWGISLYGSSAQVGLLILRTSCKLVGLYRVKEGQWLLLHRPMRIPILW